MRTIEPYHIQIFLRDGVVIAAQHNPSAVTRDEAGTVTLREVLPAEDIPFPLAVDLLGQINAGLLATLATERAAFEQERTQLLERLAAAQSAASGASPAGGSLLADLAAVFDSLPQAVQEAFAGDYAIVRLLVTADRRDLAAAHVAGLTITEDLEPVRAGILDLLAG